MDAVNSAIEAENWNDLLKLLGDLPGGSLLTQANQTRWGELGGLEVLGRAFQCPSLPLKLRFTEFVNLVRKSVVCGREHHFGNKTRAGATCLAPLLRRLGSANQEDDLICVNDTTQLIWILCNRSPTNGRIFLEQGGADVLLHLFRFQDQSVLFSACGLCCQVTDFPEICEQLLPGIEILVNLVKEGKQIAMTACTTLAEMSRNCPQQKFSPYIDTLDCIEEWVLSRDFYTYDSGLWWVTVVPILGLLASPYPSVRLFGIFKGGVAAREDKTVLRVKVFTEGFVRALSKLRKDPAPQVSFYASLAYDSITLLDESVFLDLLDKKQVAITLAQGGKFDPQLMQTLFVPTWSRFLLVILGLEDQESLLYASLVPDIIYSLCMLLFYVVADEKSSFRECVIPPELETLTKEASTIDYFL